MFILKHFLFRVLPSPQKLNDLVGERDLVYRLGYGLFWFKIRSGLARWHHTEMLKRDAWTVRAQWHRKELLRCDPEFAILEGIKNLMIKAKKAHEAGIAPLDPRYPVLETRIDKWW